MNTGTFTNKGRYVTAGGMRYDVVPLASATPALTGSRLYIPIDADWAYEFNIDTVTSMAIFGREEPIFITNGVHDPVLAPYHGIFDVTLAYVEDFAAEMRRPLPESANQYYKRRF